jgi:hypothetical protein
MDLDWLDIMPGTRASHLFRPQMICGYRILLFFCVAENLAKRFEDDISLPSFVQEILEPGETTDSFHFGMDGQYIEAVRSNHFMTLMSQSSEWLFARVTKNPMDWRILYRRRKSRCPRSMT